MDEEGLKKLEDLEKLRKLLEEQEADRQLTVLQDFYSKRAVAHASFFIASVFGLFAVLALMERYSEKIRSDSSVTAVLALLSLVYLSVGALGVYSFMNFTNYSNRAQKAVGRTAKKADESIRELKTPKTSQDKLLMTFENMKSCKWFKDHNMFLFLSAYIAVVAFAYVAFLLGTFLF